MMEKIELIQQIILIFPATFQMIISILKHLYPINSPIPFSEENIRNGYPEEANAPYGIAKRIMHVQSESYRKQYNFNSIMMLYKPFYFLL